MQTKTKLIKTHRATGNIPSKGVCKNLFCISKKATDIETLISKKNVSVEFITEKSNELKFEGQAVHRMLHESVPNLFQLRLTTLVVSAARTYLLHLLFIAIITPDGHTHRIA